MSPDEMRQHVRLDIQDARRHLDAAMRCMSVPEPMWEQASRELYLVEYECVMLERLCFKEAAKIYRLSNESRPS